VSFLALFDKSLDAFVSMQQIGEGFIRPSLVLPREFLQNPVGFLVEIDFPPHHAVRITHGAKGKTYSYLSASVGFRRAARLAGSRPNTRPTISETLNATRIESGEMGIEMSSRK
jgi:hypothetical protein